MRHLKLLTITASLLLLAGCSAGTEAPSSQQEPRSQTTSSRQSHSTSSQQSNTSSLAKTATFANQTFTISHVAFKLTGSELTNSATANRKLFVIYYTVTNHQDTAIVPSDLWQAAVSATQNGKPLGTGNLAFTTSQTADNNKLNHTVMPLKAGQTVTGLATFEPKGTQKITVTFRDTHHQIIHRSTYPL